MLARDILKLKGNAVYSVDPDSPLPQAVAVMVDKDIGSLVVQQNGRMVGLLTFREVLAALHRHQGNLHAVKVREIMVGDPLVAHPDESMDRMRSVMTENHVRYLPVLEDGRLLGIVSFHDIARAALKLASFENKLLKHYIKNWPESDNP